MLRDLVWFDGGRAANENRPDELGEHFNGCEVVHLVEPDDVLEVRPHGVPPAPPAEAGAVDQPLYTCGCGAPVGWSLEYQEDTCHGSGLHPQVCAAREELRREVREGRWPPPGDYHTEEGAP